jgi:hypothetical protein
MSTETLSDAYPDAVVAVRAFFAQFYGADIAQSEDAEEELVLFQLGPAHKVVAVSADFLAEFDKDEIREKLAGWNVAHLSRTLEPRCRLKVTSDGTEEERD